MRITVIGVLLINLSAVTEKSSCTGANWERVGISPTVAQIHALLYSRSALSAGEIADVLSVAPARSAPA